MANLRGDAQLTIRKKGKEKNKRSCLSDFRRKRKIPDERAARRGCLKEGEKQKGEKKTTKPW